MKLRFYENNKTLKTDPTITIANNEKVIGGANGIANEKFRPKNAMSRLLGT